MIDYLRGRRCEEAVAFVKKALAANDPFSVAHAVLIYDVQYPFLTPAERTSFRQQFLTAAESVYQHALHSKHWMYDRRSLNNWTYGYGECPCRTCSSSAWPSPSIPARPSTSQGKAASHLGPGGRSQQRRLEREARGV